MSENSRTKQAMNEKQLISLWNNNGLSTVKQIGINKNEHSHMFKQKLAPLLKTFSHDFWCLLRMIFIWKYNQNSLKFIRNNTHKFSILIAD